jgi:hypothetical protein
MIMRMRFYGAFFRFELDISDPEQMNRIIADCRQARKIKDFWISRRIAAVIDENNSLVYQDRKINRWWRQREVNENRYSGSSNTDT